jgi:hypothetical protein
MARPLSGYSLKAALSRDPDPSYAVVSLPHRKSRPSIFHIKRGHHRAFTEDVILPGVERIVKDEVEGLLAEVTTGFTDLQQKIDEGFKGIHDSIRVLSGDIIELRVQEKDQRHEVRLGRVEEKLGIRRR